MEIERRFLIPHPPAGLEQYPADQIRQGYLLPATSPDGVEVRVRSKGEHCFLTIKQGAGLCRTEVELPLPPADFDTLWPLTAGRRLRKTRFRLPHGDSLVIELDVYDDGPLAGLRVAEIEFPDLAASAAFQPPAFFGREITGEPAYRNASLARHGLPAGTAAATATAAVAGE